MSKPLPGIQPGPVFEAAKRSIQSSIGNAQVKHALSDDEVVAILDDLREERIAAIRRERLAMRN